MSPLDQNNEEYGTIDLKAATDDPANSDDVKFKLWKNPNQELMFGGSFEATENIKATSITASSKITSSTFRMTSGGGLNKILTSDANGNATWQTPSSGGSGSIDGLSDGKSSPVNGNVYLGQYAGDTDNSTSFKGNTGLGYGALGDLATANDGENTAIGYGAMDKYTGGLGNTAIGFNSLHGFNGPAVGDRNTALGNGALYKNTAGDGNVAIGFEAGYDETGSNKLYIHNARSTFPLIWGDFQGADVKINGSLEVTQGITGTISPPSDIRYKSNIKSLTNSLEKLINIRGVTYDWKVEEFPKKQFNNRKQIGVIAQEVEEVFPELVHTDDDGYKSVEYSKFTVLLIEAVKEQQKMINELKKQNSEVSTQNSELEKRLSNLESLVKTNRFTKASN
ncbi:MAG: tail fiber domain-containing protein [Ignavibacteriales bacterium]|nr:tail fiber domain-containing protein [Ignavibacteriales bacterium]